MKTIDSYGLRNEMNVYAQHEIKNYMIFDPEYAVLSLEGAKRDHDLYRKWLWSLGMTDYLQNIRDCDKFALLAKCHAIIRQALTPRQNLSVAAGILLYKTREGFGHAARVHFLDDRIVVSEPQTELWKEIVQTTEEKQSIWGYIF